MLKAIKDIGDLYGQIKPYDKIETDKVLVLEFNENGDFLKAYLEDFFNDKQDKYLYKSAKGSNPPTLTPTLILQRGKKKTTDKKSPVMKTLDNLEKILNKVHFETIAKPTLNKVELEEKINQVTEGVPSKEKILLTIKVGDKYVGEIKDFTKALKDFLGQEGSDSRSTGVCSICLQEKEVSGDISPFKFYTIDKPGYIAGGFRKEIAYKNFPLCYDCKDYIRTGREVVEKNLRFRIGGVMSYYLIPEFILGKETLKQETLDILLNPEVRRIMLSSQEHKSLMADEEEILDILSREKDVLTINFLFLESSQGAERIILHIQDIYPSKLKELFEAKKKIEQLLSSERFNYIFTYYTVYKFFSKSDPSKRDADLKKYFLEILDKTFRGVRIDERFLLKFIMNSIRDVIKKEEGYENLIKDAFGVFVFVKLTTGEVDMNLKLFSSLEDFLEGLPTLNSNLKKGLFLMGALTERLLRIQKNERGNKSFLKKLKGLKMNENDLKGLLPEVRNKLEEYDKFHKGEEMLFKLASEYLSKSPPVWNMSIEELNFYFSLGMGIFDKVATFIYSNIYSKKEENDEEQA